MKQKSVELEISQYSKKGHGIGCLKTKDTIKKIEVMGSVLGDTLQVALQKKKHSVYTATLLNILTPSSSRVQPKCSHALECGGCTLQQADYFSQLEYKESQVRHFFRPFSNDAHFHPIIPCKEPWQYRNKMEFSFSQNKEGVRFLGLNLSLGRGKVMNLDECHLVAPWFILVLKEVKKWWEKSSLAAYHPPSDKGSLRTLTLREGKRTGKKMIILTVSGNHDCFLKKSHLNEFKTTILKALPDENPSIFLNIHRVAKGKPTEFYEMHLHGPDTLHEILHIKERTLHFYLSPASFFQPNTLQAEKLFLHALKMTQLSPSDRVYDLYCGIGTFGALFAPFVKKVIGIEENPYAVCDGLATIEKNAISNFFILKGSVGTVLAEFQLKADLVILDPPRAGLDVSAMQHLLRLRPQKILYIACNVETQSQNILKLIEKGYILKQVQPVDQFPHTPHIENIAYLELKASINASHGL